jgi:hypothetical protein
MDRFNRLDVRIIIPHLLATFCLVFAFNSLFYLLFIEIIQTYRAEGVEGLIYLAHENDKDIVEFMRGFIIYNMVIPYLGLLLGAIISFVIIMVKRAGKINLLIVVVICLIINLLFLENGLAKISVKPGELLFGIGSLGLIFNMLIYTMLAVFLFARDWSGTLALMKPAE